MRTNKTIRHNPMTLYVLILIAPILFQLGCASTDESRMPAGYDEGETNAHPASYLVDRFQVNRPMPKHEKTGGVEFYFKSCEMSGERWPHSRTAYDCNYP